MYLLLLKGFYFVGVGNKLNLKKPPAYLCKQEAILFPKEKG